MLPIGWTALISGAFVLALGLRRTGRLAGVWALVVACACFGAGLVRQELVVSDLWGLPTHTGMGTGALLLVSWLLLAAALRHLGPGVLPGMGRVPPVIVAAGAGLVLGELAAAALLGGAARDRAGASRLVVAAMGGAMVGRIGDPALLILGEQVPAVGLLLAPVGLVLVALGAPRSGDLVVTTDRNPLALGLVGLVAVAGAVPGLAVFAVPAGAVLLGGLALRADGTRALERILGHGARGVGIAGVVLMATAAGLPELGALGLEEIGEALGREAGPLIAAGAWVLAALVDGGGSALLLGGVVERGLSLGTPGIIDGQGVALSVAVGAGCGGIGPLLVAGVLREGWWRWLLSLPVAMVAAWVLAPV